MKEEYNFKLRPRLVLGSIGAAFLLVAGFVFNHIRLDWPSFILGIVGTLGAILLFVFDPFKGKNPKSDT